MRPVARVVRAGGHVAERRDHFLLADNAGIRECRGVYLAVCTKRLLRLLRRHSRTGGLRSLFLAASEFGYRSQQLTPMTKRHPDVF